MFKVGDKVVAKHRYNEQVIEGIIDDIDGHYAIYIRDADNIHLIERRLWDIKLREE